MAKWNIHSDPSLNDEIMEQHFPICCSSSNNGQQNVNRGDRENATIIISRYVVCWQCRGTRWIISYDLYDAFNGNGISNEYKERGSGKMHG